MLSALWSINVHYVVSLHVWSFFYAYYLCILCFLVGVVPIEIHLELNLVSFCWMPFDNLAFMCFNFDNFPDVSSFDKFCKTFFYKITILCAIAAACRHRSVADGIPNDSWVVWNPAISSRYADKIVWIVGEVKERGLSFLHLILEEGFSCLNFWFGSFFSFLFLIECGHTNSSGDG